MGGGDWNDGMNEVGAMGKGESIWLAWFLYTVLSDFIPLCDQEGDEACSRELEQKRETLLQNIEEHGGAANTGDDLRASGVSDAASGLFGSFGGSTDGDYHSHSSVCNGSGAGFL